MSFGVLRWLNGKESTCQCRRSDAGDMGLILCWEDPLEKGMETYFSILAWRIPWTEKSGGLQSIGSQRAGHDWESEHTCRKDPVKVHTLYLVVTPSLLYFLNYYYYYFTVYIGCAGSSLWCMVSVVAVQGLSCNMWGLSSLIRSLGL